MTKENVEIEFEMVDWPHPAKSRGVEAMRETWLATLSAWDDVLVLNHISGRGRGSGADVSALTATVWTGEHGKVVRLALYWDTERAREAAEGRG